MVSGSPTAGNLRCAAAGTARVAASRPPIHHYNAFGPHSGNSPNSTTQQEGDDRERMNAHTIGVMAQGLQQYTEVSVNLTIEGSTRARHPHSGRSGSDSNASSAT